jgi:hypothetical protein
MPLLLLLCSLLLLRSMLLPCGMACMRMFANQELLLLLCVCSWGCSCRLRCIMLLPKASAQTAYLGAPSISTVL